MQAQSNPTSSDTTPTGATPWPTRLQYPQLVQLGALRTPSIAEIKARAREGAARLEVGGDQAWVDGGCEGLWQSLFVAILNGHTVLAETPLVHAVAVESLGV